MINRHENIKANEGRNLRSNLQSSANGLATFQSFLSKSVASTNPERDRTHLRSFHLN